MEEDPGIGLFINAQLIRECRWQSFKDIFRKYEQIHQNLVPLLKFWRFQISQSTIDELIHYPIPEIVDHFDYDCSL